MWFIKQRKNPKKSSLCFTCILLSWHDDLALDIHYRLSSTVHEASTKNGYANATKVWDRKFLRFNFGETFSGKDKPQRVAENYLYNFLWYFIVKFSLNLNYRPTLKIVISKMLNVKTPQHMRQHPRLYAGVTTMLSPFNRFAFWPVHFCVQRG